MLGAIAQLEISLDVLTTNEPINRERGDIDQADLEARNASEIREALEVLRGIEEGKVVQSKYQIGDRVKVLGAHEAAVGAIRFTEGKVCYDVNLVVFNTWLENVDSFFVTDIEVPT